MRSAELSTCQNDTVKTYLEGGPMLSQKNDAGSEAGLKWHPDRAISAYVSLTDRMIQRFGGYRDDLPEDEPVPDTVIFLDKSARPVAWLVDSLWKRMADPEAARPDFDFINIDRKTWWQIVGQEIVGEMNRDPADFNIDRVPQEFIDAIRARFVIGDVTREDYRGKVWSLPTRLDGQEVLIVDEVKSSGATLEMAKALLGRAIPEANFSGDHFWKTPFAEGGVCRDYRQSDEYKVCAATDAQPAVLV